MAANMTTSEGFSAEMLRFAPSTHRGRCYLNPASYLERAQQAAFEKVILGNALAGARWLRVGFMPYHAMLVLLSLQVCLVMPVDECGQLGTPTSWQPLSTCCQGCRHQATWEAVAERQGNTKTRPNLGPYLSCHRSRSGHLQWLSRPGG